MRGVSGGRQAFMLVLALSGLVGPVTHGVAQDGRSVDLRSVTTTLEREVYRAMVEGQVPSLTIALVSRDQVIWSAGYGETNLYTRAPATPGSVYMVASTFKPMAAAAILQLHAEGGFDLDDPVRDYLDEVRILNEDRRNRVSFRHLLTHTSGLPTTFTAVPLWEDRVPPSMDRFLKENLILQSAPLQRVRYSNIGFTLLAHLLEEISGHTFQDYVRRHIFLPSGMTSTDFVPTPAMEERMALPYVPDPDTGRLVPVSRLRVAEWPAGGVWGTVEDQARWLAVNLNQGTVRGRQVLSPEMVRLSHTLQYEQFTGSMAGGWGDGQAGYGLGWWTSERDGEQYIAHAGSMQGYTSFMHGNLDTGFGVAILSNGHRAHSHLVRLAYLATDLLAEHSR
jgi:CubicO group peptidase (beta-lactamase class C family)